MAESMAEQLAAAHAQNKRLTATLQERDHTISQLRRENQELSETVALQAQTLREQEAALDTAVRVPAGGSQPHPPAQREQGRLLVPSAPGGRSPGSFCGARTERVCGKQAPSAVRKKRARSHLSPGPEGVEAEVGAGAAGAGRGRTTAGWGGGERCG